MPTLAYKGSWKGSWVGKTRAKVLNEMGEGVDISWRNTFNISIRKGSKKSCTIWKVTKRVKCLVAWVKTRSTILRKFIQYHSLIGTGILGSCSLILFTNC